MSILSSEDYLNNLTNRFSIHEFSYGVANRGASVRIPRQVEKDGFGYFEVFKQFLGSITSIGRKILDQYVSLPISREGAQNHTIEFSVAKHPSQSKL